MNSQNTKSKYGTAADAFLEQFYTSTGAISTEQKIIVLEMKLGLPPSNYYAFGGAVTPEMKLGCLEYEFLEQEGKITLELA